MKRMLPIVFLSAGIMLLFFSGCRSAAELMTPQPSEVSGVEIRQEKVSGSEEHHLDLSNMEVETTALHRDASALRPQAYKESPTLPLPVDGCLSITIEEAVFMAIQNNRSLTVQIFSPLIAGTFEELERSRFDAALFADFSISRDKTEMIDRSSATMDGRGESETYRLGVEQTLPSGTDITLSLSQTRSDSSTSRERRGAGVEATLTQALLRGRGLERNLARIHQAELGTMASFYEVRGFTEALVAEVERTYWDYVLARQRVVIFEESLRVAQRQADDIERRIEVGTIAETELAAAQAELAFRRQGLLDSENHRDRVRLSLLRLLNPAGGNDWSLEIESLDSPHGPGEELDPVDDHVALGLRMRPEIAEAGLRIKQGRLEIIQTRNGLLPRLDLFLTLGKTGYADSFGGSLSNIGGSYYDTKAGLKFEWILGNRAGEASDRRARAGHAQARASLDNLSQLVEQDIREAYLEVERARAQIGASAVRRRLQEEVVRAEQVKFDVGRGTALTVAQAQRDLLESRLDEIKAVIDYRTARMNLYRLDGSLLSRRGIETQGTFF